MTRDSDDSCAGHEAECSKLPNVAEHDDLRAAVTPYQVCNPSTLVGRGLSRTGQLFVVEVESQWADDDTGYVRRPGWYMVWHDRELPDTYPERAWGPYQTRDDAVAALAQEFGLRDGRAPVWVTPEAVAEHVLWIWAARQGLVPEVGSLGWCRLMEGRPRASADWCRRHDHIEHFLERGAFLFTNDEQAQMLIAQALWNDPDEWPWDY